MEKEFEDIQKTFKKVIKTDKNIVKKWLGFNKWLKKEFLF